MIVERKQKKGKRNEVKHIKTGVPLSYRNNTGAETMNTSKNNKLIYETEFEKDYLCFYIRESILGDFTSSLCSHSTAQTN